MLAALSFVGAVAIVSNDSLADSLLSPTSNSDYTEIRIPLLIFTGAASGHSTNLFNGWSSVTSYTNISQAWNATNASFTYTTNVTSITNTVFADFDALGQNNVKLQTRFKGNGDSNYYFVVSRSIDGIKFPTNATDVTKFTNAPVGTAAFTDDTANIDMTGFRYGRIIEFTWTETNTVNKLTNSFLAKSNKKDF